MRPTRFSIPSLIFPLILIYLLTGCALAVEPVSEETISGEQATAAVVPVPEDAEWIVLSGVDEHGWIAEGELQLLASPDPEAGIVASVPTGVPVVVEEKINTGPQNLRRFYRVLSLNGMSGWISDYYVRRTVYIFDVSRQTVRLYDDPGGEVAADITNIYPVIVIDAARPDWWRVETADGLYQGWIPAEQVKESSEPEFLFIQDPNHVHDGTHDH